MRFSKFLQKFNQLINVLAVSKNSRLGAILISKMVDKFSVRVANRDHSREDYH